MIAPTTEKDVRRGLPSASQFHRLVNCPASRNAEAMMSDESPDSAIASEGTAIHAAVAAEDMAELGLTAESVAVKLLEMRNSAISQWESDFGVEDYIVVAQDRPSDRLWLKDSKGNEVVSALLDHACVSKDGKSAAIIDLKSGFKEVTPSASNFQLKIQLACVKQAYPTIEKARIAIAQYRLGSKFDACDYLNGEDFKQDMMEIAFYLRRSQRSDAEFSAGSWCEYCKARSLCPTFASWALMPMSRPNLLTQPVKKAEIESRVAQLSLQDLAYIESRRTMANNLFSSVSSRLKSMTVEELATVGLTKVPGRMTTDVPDLQELWRVLANQRLISPEEFRSICDINLGRMKELLVARLKLMNQSTVEQAEKTLEEIIAPVVKKERGAETLK